MLSTSGISTSSRDANVLGVYAHADRVDPIKSSAPFGIKLHYIYRLIIPILHPSLIFPFLLLPFLSSPYWIFLQYLFRLSCHFYLILSSYNSNNNNILTGISDRYLSKSLQEKSSIMCHVFTIILFIHHTLRNILFQKTTGTE